MEPYERIQLNDAPQLNSPGIAKYTFVWSSNFLLPVAIYSHRSLKMCLSLLVSEFCVFSSVIHNNFVYVVCFILILLSDLFDGHTRYVLQFISRKHNHHRFFNFSILFYWSQILTAAYMCWYYHYLTKIQKYFLVTFFKNASNFQYISRKLCILFYMIFLFM
jgi:hypothetical protein